MSSKRGLLPDVQLHRHYCKMWGHVRLRQYLSHWARQGCTSRTAACTARGTPAQLPGSSLSKGVERQLLHSTCQCGEVQSMCFLLTQWLRNVFHSSSSIVRGLRAYDHGAACATLCLSGVVLQHILERLLLSH